MKAVPDRTYFVDARLSRHGAEVVGQDKNLSRAVNVRPVFPCKARGT
jgi:hypothetical protein